jgi:L-ascorbate metabolism protein UlaG (beta-lactamase superfamily)
MKISWLKHAAFKIETEDKKIVYLDPYQISKSEEKADIIICSHEHGDHFDEKSIKNIWKESTVLLGPKSISPKLMKFNGRGLEFYNPFQLGKIKIELVPAYNIKRTRPNTNETFHPINRKWAGSVLEIEGKKIYHAGDSERIPEMKELASKGIYIAMLPCGGTYTMDIEESTDAALDINPKIVIPMHNWDKELEEYKKILHSKNPNIKVEILHDKELFI